MGHTLTDAIFEALHKKWCTFNSL